jgi:hypothetical protein
MKALIMMVDSDHIFRVSVFLDMHPACIRFVKSELRIIVFVVVIVSQLLGKNKKSSSSHQDMMVIAVIYRLMKLVNVSKMEINM